MQVPASHPSSVLAHEELERAWSRIAVLQAFGPVDPFASLAPSPLTPEDTLAACDGARGAGIAALRRLVPALVGYTTEFARRAGFDPDAEGEAQRMPPGRFAAGLRAYARYRDALTVLDLAASGIDLVDGPLAADALIAIEARRDEAAREVVDALSAVLRLQLTGVVGRGAELETVEG